MKQETSQALSKSLQSVSKTYKEERTIPGGGGTPIGKCYSWFAVFVVTICARMPCAHVVVDNRYV